MDGIKKLLHETNAISHSNQGILIAQVKDTQTGLALGQEILEQIVDSRTLLLLSGGRTPKELYTSLAQSEAIKPGAVGMIDERFGEKMHAESNEKMIEGTGLLRYLEMRGIDFYPILATAEPRTAIARKYDEKLRDLQFLYQKTVGILGIGLDGHTAGIPVSNPAVRVHYSDTYQESDLVADYADTSGKYGERVTMTFLGLEHVDLFVVLVFGDDKQEALHDVFLGGKETEIPGRFYLRPDTAKRTIFITDQNI